MKNNEPRLEEERVPVMVVLWGGGWVRVRVWAGEEEGRGGVAAAAKWKHSI